MLYSEVRYLYSDLNVKLIEIWLMAESIELGFGSTRRKQQEKRETGETGNWNEKKGLNQEKKDGLFGSNQGES